MRPFSTSLMAVISGFLLLVLHYAAIETFGPKKRNMILPFHIVLIVFSVGLLVLTLIKSRLLRSGAALKMRRQVSSDREREGIKKDVTFFKYGQKLIHMRSGIITESILKNSGNVGMIDV